MASPQSGAAAGTSISVRGLGLSFDAQAVLSDIDLEVPGGTTLALLGPSGCGKSTLLKLLAGLQQPGAGSIRFGDQLVADAQTCVAPERRGLGMVFQDYALWPHMTVAGNVSFPLEMGGVRRTSASIASLRRWPASVWDMSANGAFRHCRADSSNVSPWRAPSSQNRGFFCSMSRFPISTAICV